MSNKVIIVDDVYDQEDIKKNERIIQSHARWTYSHSSNSGEEDGVTFFISELDHDECFLTKQIITDFFLEANVKLVSRPPDVYLNGQTYGLDGTWHTDDDELKDRHTLLYMVNSGDTEKIGDFQYIDPSNKGYIETVEFKPGRLVLFPSHWDHRGLAPTTKNKMRITLAYKVMEVEFL